MPDRKITGAEKYRFGYQGQFAEEDEETGLNHFEARLWDSRLGRWLTTDPAGQYASPYLGMGNSSINIIDPDGEDGIYASSKTSKKTRVERPGNDQYFLDGVLQGYTYADAWKDAIVRPSKIGLNKNGTSIRNQTLDWFRYMKIFKFNDITKQNSGGFYLNDIIDINTLVNTGYDIGYPKIFDDDIEGAQTVIIPNPFDLPYCSKQRNANYDKNRYINGMRYYGPNMPVNNFDDTYISAISNFNYPSAVITIHTGANHKLYHKFKNYIQDGVDFRK